MSRAKVKSAPEQGHNSVSADRLRNLVERIERLEEERATLGSDVKDIYAEAKSSGFDVKVLRRLIRDRRQDAADVEEMEALLDTYKRALGMLSDTPLGISAMRAVSPIAHLRDKAGALDALADKVGGSITLSTSGEPPVVFGTKARASAAE